jgi:hypothetical protein
MISNVSSTPTTPATPTPTAAPAPDVHAGGGIQGFIGDVLRGAGDGYQQATKLTGVQADKAAIHPFEAVSTATGILKAKTANIKGVSKVTGILHTVGGFAMLIMTANASGVLKSPGVTANELAHKAADMIDGKETATGFTPGWFMTPSADGTPAPLVESEVGSALGSLGMK